MGRSLEEIISAQGGIDEMFSRSKWIIASGIAVVAVVLLAGRNVLWDWATATPTKTAEEYKALAITALKNMEVGDAISALQQAVALKPASAELHYLLGQAQETSGRRDEAAQEYQKTIDLNPGLAAPRYNLAVIYQSQGLYDAMEEQLTKALEISPEFSAAHLLLGTVYYGKQDWERAISELSLVIGKSSAIVPDPIAVHRMLARSAAALGRTDVAAEHWRAILVLDPNDSEALTY